MFSGLQFTAASGAVVGLLYLYTGGRLLGRNVSVEARGALQSFSLWWLAIGASSLLGALQIWLYLSDKLPIWIYAANTQVAIMLIVAALYGLLDYLVYLYTGTAKWRMPLAVLYFVVWVLLVGLIERAGTPDRLTDNGWNIVAEPQLQLGGVATIIFVLFLLGPQLAGAIGYARLYKKVETRTSRYRIVLVAGSIIVWFGSSLIASALGAASDVDLSTLAAWQIGSRMIGIAAALALYFAYFPPHWVRQKYGIEALG